VFNSDEGDKIILTTNH